MPGIEDLLGDDDEDTTDQRQSTDQRSNAEKRLDRDKKRLQEQLAELQAWKAERERADRQEAVSAAFKDIGLNPKHAKFYPEDGEFTEEAVKTWAISEELLVPSEDEPAPTVEERGFTPTVISGGTAMGTKSYSVAEWKSISLQNPALGQQLLEQGRVNMAEARQGLGPDR